MRKATILLLAMVFSLAAFAQDTKSKETKPTDKKIPANSKVFLNPMGGFEEDLRAAIQSRWKQTCLTCCCGHGTRTSQTRLEIA